MNSLPISTIYYKPNPADLIAYADHETMMQVLDAIAARITALPNTPEECHQTSDARRSCSVLLRMEKASAAQAIETIRGTLEHFARKDKD